MRPKLKLFALVFLCVVPSLMLSQSQQTAGLNPADILKPLRDSWPTYSGDYSGKRYSALTDINQSNVKSLTLAWSTRLTGGAGNAGGGAGGPGGGGPGGG